MSLPAAVQRQIEEADRMMAAFGGDQTVETTETVPPAEPAEVQAPPAAEPVSTETQPQPTGSENDDTWRAKYLTLKGMFDAEVPRKAAEIRELREQLQATMNEMAQLRVAATPSAPAAKDATLFTEDDKEAFGTDLLSVIERATQAAVNPLNAEIERLKSENERLVSKVGNVSERVQVSDTDRFKAGLAQQVSDWEAVNVDPGFLQWLSEADPVYGLPRQQALNAAVEVMDVDRVATIFNAFKATRAPQPTARQQLSRQVAPTRSRTTAAPAESQNFRVYTEREIAQFYDDQRRGFLEPDEAARMEREIYAAIAEGRVRP